MWLDNWKARGQMACRVRRGVTQWLACLFWEQKAACSSHATPRRSSQQGGGWKLKKKKRKMEIGTSFFYLFASLGLLSAILVIWSKNPVHSVLFLVLVFCNGAGILLLLEVEFLAMIFLVVYVGAIAVLFLFVVMMLAPRESGAGGASQMRGPIFFFCAGLGVLGLQGSLGSGGTGPRGSESLVDLLDGTGGGTSNLESLGQVLYTYYFYYFLVAGFVLLIAMIGAIVLTLEVKGEDAGVKGQYVSEQLARGPEEAVFLMAAGPAVGKR